MRIMPQDVAEIEGAALAPAELAAINIAGSETVLIPDVSVLEKAYSDYLKTR